MAHLTRSDLEAALAFAAELGTAAPQHDRADVWFLERIAQMIDLEAADYSLHSELRPRTLLSDAEYSGGGSDTAPEEWAPTDHEWAVIKAEMPFWRYVVRTGDRFFSAHRTTDVVDMRTFSRTEYFEVFDVASMPREIQMRLPGEPDTHWTLSVARSGRDFTDRDKLLLDVLRPFLIAYESHRTVAAKLADLQAMRPDSTADGVLSVRENEVMDLVAGGATNAQIAERLWISPATVKKHLEHIYLKLEVGSRTAALARTGRASAAPESREG